MHVLSLKVGSPTLVTQCEGVYSHALLKEEKTPVDMTGVFGPFGILTHLFYRGNTH